MADDSIEGRMLQEIEAINKQINDLLRQREACEVILTRARRQNAGLQDVTRKNSINRVLIENRIIEALKRANKRVSTDDLFREAKYADLTLNNSTFRTQLHRMKKRDLIESAGRGYWKLKAQSLSATG